MTNTLADRLEYARRQAGLTQGQIAKLMRLPRTAVTGIENATRRCSALELADFAQHYGVSEHWLLHGISAKPVELPPPEQLAKLSAADRETLVTLFHAMARDNE